MTLRIAFGASGSPTQWFLPGTDSSMLPELPEALAPNPVANAVLPVAFTPASDREVAVHGGAVLVGTTGFGTEAEHTLIDAVGAWNGVKNAVAFGAEAADLTFAGFVHVDVAVGLEEGGGSEIAVLGAKRGNVVTGTGADLIDVQVQTNGGHWVNEFRIAPDGGDDVVRVSPFDAAAAAAAGDATFAATTGGAGPLVQDYDGGLTRAIVDLGEGDDRYDSLGQVVDLVRGGNGNDVVALGGGDDAAIGGAGSDTLDGGTGNDALEGGRGDDRLLGGDGDDALSGGQGTNLFQGGAGADRFVIGGLLDPTRGGAPSVVEDFARGEGDRLDLLELGVSAFASVHIDVVNEGMDSLLTFLDDGSVEAGSVLVVGRTDLGAADFIFAA